MPDDWVKLNGWLNPLAVIVGGGAGAWARYAIAWLVAGLHAGHAFPWPTFGINVVGSFLLGLFVVWFRAHPQPVWYMLLGIGFCGGFTTFSTFSIETLELIEKDCLGLAVLYASGSVAAGLLGAMLAVRIAKGL